MTSIIIIIIIVTYWYTILVKWCQEEWLSVGIQLTKLPLKILRKFQEELLFFIVGTIRLWNSTSTAVENFNR